MRYKHSEVISGLINTERCNKGFLGINCAILQELVCWIHEIYLKQTPIKAFRNESCFANGSQWTSDQLSQDQKDWKIFKT